MPCLPDQPPPDLASRPKEFVPYCDGAASSAGRYRATLTAKGSSEGTSSSELRNIILIKKETHQTWYCPATPVRSNGRSHPLELSVHAPSPEAAEEVARQFRAGEAKITLQLRSQRDIPRRLDRPHNGSAASSLEMLPPGGANGRMEGDYLAVMGAQEGKNNPKWARQYGVFAGSSSWPYEYVPVAKEGESPPPLGKKWVTVSQNGAKKRDLQATMVPIPGTALHLGLQGIAVGDIASGGVMVTDCKATLVLKLVNNLSSHCKLYDTNFFWISSVVLARGLCDHPICAQSNMVFYYSNARGLKFTEVNTSNSAAMSQQGVKRPAEGQPIEENGSSKRPVSNAPVKRGARYEPLHPLTECDDSLNRLQGSAAPSSDEVSDESSVTVKSADDFDLGVKKSTSLDALVQVAVQLGGDDDETPAI